MKLRHYLFLALIALCFGICGQGCKSAGKGGISLATFKAADEIKAADKITGVEKLQVADKLDMKEIVASAVAQAMVDLKVQGQAGFGNKMQENSNKAGGNLETKINDAKMITWIFAIGGAVVIAGLVLLIVIVVMYFKSKNLKALAKEKEIEADTYKIEAHHRITNPEEKEALENKIRAKKGK